MVRYSKAGYTKGGQGSRRYNRAKGYAKTGMSALKMASKAYTAAMAVKALINVEFKHLDTTSTTPVSTTPRVIHLTNVSSGDTTRSRDGMSIRAKSLHMRGSLQVDQAAAADRVRMLVVRAITDDIPTWDLLIDGSSNLDGHRDLNHTNQFKVLSDKTYNLAELRNPNQSITNHFKLDHHVTWDQLATTTRGGHLYLLHLGTEAVNTTAINLHCRLRYIDN